MANTIKHSAILLLTLAGFTLPLPALTAWSTDPAAPTPVCTEEYRQYDPRIVAVDGGFVVSWNDTRRENAFLDVYAQKLDIDGETLWPENGRVIAEGPAGSLVYQWQLSTGLADDGAGGALIAWNDFYAPYYSYFQGFVTRAASDATVAWGDPGELIQPPDTAVPMMANPLGLNQLSTEWDIAADSEGGLFVPVPGIPHSIARFAHDGEQRTGWYTAAGESAAQYLRLVPSVEAGEDDAVMVVWVDNVSLSDDTILARKLLDPETDWPAQPDTLLSAWGEQPVQIDDDPATSEPETIANVCRLAAVPDGAGGVIAAWVDDRVRPDTAYFRVYAQRIDAQGNPLWPEGGVEVSGDVMTYGCYWWMEMHAVADGAGGVVIAWNEIDGTSRLLRAQRLDSNGNPLWAPGGVVLDVDSYAGNTILGVVRSSDGNFITLNHLSTVTNVRPGALMTQKLGAVDGEPMWGDGRLAFEGCFSNYNSNAGIAPDGAGGAVITFEACDNNIYASRTEVRADLTVNKVMAPRMLREDKPVSVRILVGNSGEADVTGSYSIGLYLDGDLLKETEVNDIPAAGTETTINLTGVRITDPSPGSHTLEAVVDIYEEIPEMHEDNNTASINVRVK